MAVRVYVPAVLMVRPLKVGRAPDGVDGQGAAEHGAAGRTSVTGPLKVVSMMPEPFSSATVRPKEVFGVTLAAVVVTTSWGLTVSVSTCEVLPLQTAVAVIDGGDGRVPIASVLMLKVVVPPASRTVPRVAVPSLKVTVPVGFAVPVAGVTVAVKVTDCPRRDGLLLEARAVVVTTSWG